MAKARKGSRRAGALRGGRSKIARSRGRGTVALHSRAGGIATFAKGGGGGGYRGFKSKKQWRWAWATHQPWARKKSHETAGGPKVRYRRLPASKHSGHKGSRAPS
ncbi:hypothetical protein SEA_VIOLETZ_75 [Mycobacterium phage VioletZ]|uniref:Uncharacterized protein n=1 Tax=Mycobacterium phage VioletZ TaxID=2768140 RepID=A0A7G9W384_9CAUD|nr:hypothetical protein SEA_VIOLETZ_75 [Mycobacterium phage VioletZ]